MYVLIAGMAVALAFAAGDPVTRVLASLGAAAALLNAGLTLRARLTGR
jgi:hypothetical protein